MLREMKRTQAHGQRLDRKAGVKKDGTRIVSIMMESGETYAGKVFIDATYEGDLMAKAGVSYHVGREANRTYGETLNGVQVKNAVHHQFVKKIDPYVKPGDATSGLLPRVHATRAKIVREHIDYQTGLMWTLANNPRVPEKVRQHFQTWGLAKDEFTDTDNWPHQLYVREARRLVGEYVMIEQNCRGQRVAADSAGLAAYTMDSHNVQR